MKRYFKAISEAVFFVFLGCGFFGSLFGAGYNAAAGNWKMAAVLGGFAILVIVSFVTLTILADE